MWYLDIVRIFVQQNNPQINQIIARLTPNEGPTILHIWGDESPIHNINAYVVGTGDISLLESYSRDGATHVLSGPDGVVGNFYINSISHNQTMGTAQTIRTDLPENSNVYVVDLELYEDE